MFRPCKWAIIRLFVEPVSWLYPYCIINLLFLRITWWWPTYKAETCSCILHIFAYYILIPSDKLLCFWLHVYMNIHIIIYIILGFLFTDFHEADTHWHYGKYFTENFTKIVQEMWKAGLQVHLSPVVNCKLRLSRNYLNFVGLTTYRRELLHRISWKLDIIFIG